MLMLHIVYALMELLLSENMQRILDATCFEMTLEGLRIKESACIFCLRLNLLVPNEM